LEAAIEIQPKAGTQWYRNYGQPVGRTLNRTGRSVACKVVEPVLRDRRTPMAAAV